MSENIRIIFPSPITSNEICIGRIIQTPKGFWLPKIRITGCTYQNIKDGVAQLTQDQAKNIVIRAYYEYVGKKRGWTTAEVEFHLSKGYQLHQAKEQERLASEAENEVRKQRDRERNQGNLAISHKPIIELKHFQLYSVMFSDKTIYKVRIKKMKGWPKLCAQIAELKLGQKNQKQWTFDTLDAAVSFLMLLPKSNFRPDSYERMRATAAENGQLMLPLWTGYGSSDR